MKGRGRGIQGWDFRPRIICRYTFRIQVIQGRTPISCARHDQVKGRHLIIVSGRGSKLIIWVIVVIGARRVCHTLLALPPPLLHYITVSEGTGHLNYKQDQEKQVAQNTEPKGTKEPMILESQSRLVYPLTGTSFFFFYCQIYYTNKCLFSNTAASLIVTAAGARGARGARGANHIWRYFSRAK